MVSTCGVPTVQVRLAGVASTLPAVSVALTSKAWEPSGRFGWLFGEARPAKAAASLEAAAFEPRPAKETSVSCGLGEVDHGLLGGIGYLRVGAGSAVQRVVAVHAVLGVDRVVAVLAI